MFNCSFLFILMTLFSFLFFVAWGGPFYAIHFNIQRSFHSFGFGTVVRFGPASLLSFTSFAVLYWRYGTEVCWVAFELPFLDARM